MNPPRRLRPAVPARAAAGTYAASCVLGTAVLTGRLDTSSARWVHHALFVATLTSTLAAASSLLWSPSRAGWAHVAALVPLSIIPFAGTSGRRHVVLGLAVAPPILAGLVAAQRA